MAPLKASLLSTRPPSNSSPTLTAFLNSHSNPKILTVSITAKRKCILFNSNYKTKTKIVVQQPQVFQQQQQQQQPQQPQAPAPTVVAQTDNATKQLLLESKEEQMAIKTSSAYIRTAQEEIKSSVGTVAVRVEDMASKLERIATR